MRKTERMIGAAMALLVAGAMSLALAGTSAQAIPIIKWVGATAGSTPTSFLGAINYASQVSYPVTYANELATEGALNQKLTSTISVNSTNTTGVPYGSSVIYAQAISDTLATNKRGGIIDGTQNGGWGELDVLGKTVSTRTGSPVRSYSEATADAFLTFTIMNKVGDDPWTKPVKVEFTVEFASVIKDGFNGNLNIYRNMTPVAATDDRFANFATFGGLVQNGRPVVIQTSPLVRKPFILEDDLNLSQKLYDIDTGKAVGITFDDPARPEQFDPAATSAPFPILEQRDPFSPATVTNTNDNLLWGPGSGRGGPIPDASTGFTMKSRRTRLYMDDLDTTVDTIEMQEPLLQDTASTNPANDPLLTLRSNNKQFTRGDTTFNNGLGSHKFTFYVDPADFGKPLSLYAQLSVNLATDGGVDGYWGNIEDQTKQSTLFYNVKIVPEPGTWMMIGSGLLVTLGTAVMRRRAKAIH